MMFTKIIGHMGTDAYAPRNTMPAFELAISMGADGIELDVNRSADGNIVVIHDETIDDTSNGKGRVDEMTLDQLRQYDYCYRFGNQYTGVIIPTLTDIYELIKSTNLIINIEIKGTPDLYRGIESQLISISKSMSMQDRVIYSSFDYQYLINILKTDPTARCAMLHRAGIEKPWDYAKALGMAAINPPFEVVDANYVENCHRLGLEVFPWTVDEPTKIRYMLALEVDGIITNYPDVGLCQRNNYLYKSFNK